MTPMGAARDAFMAALTKKDKVTIALTVVVGTSFYLGFMLGRR